MLTDTPRRGICPVCNRGIGLIPSSGLVRRHEMTDRSGALPGRLDPAVCQGSWEQPTSVVIPDRERDLAYRVAALESVLRDREAELWELKGPCSNGRCCLHYAHSGPCNTTAYYRALLEKEATS